MHVQRPYWIGKTESALSAELATEMTRPVIQDTCAIAAVDANATVPYHHIPHDVIEMGKSLLADFSGTYMYYYTDMTRSHFFGKSNS